MFADTFSIFFSVVLTKFQSRSGYVKKFIELSVPG